MPSPPISTMKKNQRRYSSLSHLFYQKRLWAKQPKWLKANLVNEIRKEEQPSSTTWCGPKKVVLFFSVEMDCSTGRSIHDGFEWRQLRMVRVEEGSSPALGHFSLSYRIILELFLSRNASASVPSTIESRDGKSITHSLLSTITLKGDARAELTTIGTQSNGRQKRQVYSSLQKERNHSQTLPENKIQQSGIRIWRTPTLASHSSSIRIISERSLFQ